MNLLKAAASVSAMTLLSRLTGFARDVIPVQAVPRPRARGERIGPEQ